MTSSLKEPELTSNYTKDMLEHSYKGQRPITPTETYPSPESVPLDNSVDKIMRNESNSDSNLEEKKSSEIIAEKHANNNNKIKEKKTKKPRHRASNHANELEQLLEDASRYDPACEYSLPTSYRRSRSYRCYSEENLDHLKEKTEQKPIPKKRRLIRASELHKSNISEATPRQTEIEDSITVKKENQNIKGLPRGLKSMSKKQPIKKTSKSQKVEDEVAKTPGKSGRKKSPQQSVKDLSGRKPKPQNGNSKKKLASPVKSSPGKKLTLKKHVVKKSLSSTKQINSEIENDDEEEKEVNKSDSLKSKASKTDKETASEDGEDVPSTFFDWNGPMFDITDTFFDIDSLKKSNFFQGKIIGSTVVTHHNDTCNDTIHKNTRYYGGKKYSAKDVLIELKSPLFFNQSETFAIDFATDLTRYNPMLEIGKMIEYVALVYLPEPYSTLMKIDIIPDLNEAYDTSNGDKFVQMVNKYNKFIETVPRNEILEHLNNLKHVPLSFIHDFLQTVYIRAIHPRASELKHYEAFSNYVYGELLPSFLSKVYQQCNLNKSSTFLDLGSGVGNCVIQASLEYHCKLSAGCEIMKEASELTECQYKELQERCKLMGLTLKPIKYFLRESFVGHEGVKEVIKDCDVLLINNFLFDMELNREVEKLLQSCKVGCKIISLKSLRAPGYAVDFYNTDNIMSRLKVEKFEFGEDSVSWTHSGGEYYISTVLDAIDESLLDISSRFRRSRQPVKYTK